MRIGVYDSGIGGLTTLSRLILSFPDCDYLYFADNDLFPFGQKNSELLKKNLLQKIKVIKKETDLIVVGCYTASSLVGDSIKDVYTLKPYIDKNTLLIATPNTINNVKPDCMTGNTPDLAGIIQYCYTANKECSAIDDYLYQTLGCYYGVETVSLGCTHYNFVKDKIQNLLCPKRIVDGNDELIYKLAFAVKPSESRGKVSFSFSGEEQTAIYAELLKRLINKKI